MGRPSIDSEAVNVRIERTLIDALDAWISKQSDLPTRPEAIRRLIKNALSRETENKQDTIRS